jgi:hypothetical protein
MTFRWWMAPAIGVGIVALANTALIITALNVRPQKTSDRPYADSAEEDARAAERSGFRALGWRIDQEVDATGATLRLHAPGGAGPGILRLYRPDDRSADREVAWRDPAQPLRLDLPRPGVWHLAATFADPNGAVVAERIDLLRP